MPAQSHYRICPLCEACCGLEVKTEGTKVVSIRGADNDVFSHGYLCPKGVSLKDLHEDPDRLRTPLIKRDGRFVPASWDEAFAEIERRLLPVWREQGPDAVALTIGNPAAHKVSLLAYTPRLVRALGTRNVFSASTLDQMPKQLSSALMFGHWLSIPLPDIERCDYLLMLGANPMVSNGSLWTVPDYRGKAKAMRARGGQLARRRLRSHRHLHDALRHRELLARGPAQRADRQPRPRRRRDVRQGRSLRIQHAGPARQRQGRDDRPAQEPRVGRARGFRGAADHRDGRRDRDRR
jgi:predicted molibdopterin-dependent oxidoreductase YjgC